MPEIAVIVCAHNPRERFLDAVLSALQAQTLPVARWELVLVDNASNEPLAGRFNLGWHPHARVIHENQLGLTNARLCGLTSTSAPVLVYVDDDNVLAPDYLETALRLFRQQSRLGVCSGRIELQFENTPPEWTDRYRPFLVERLVDNDATASNLDLSGPLPVGAGLCIRREPMQEYGRLVQEDPLRQALDRSGTLLSSGGDTDIALTVCEGGWDRGVFKDLQMRHLIPSERLTEAYLVRLVGGICFSTMLLELIHKPHVPPPPTNLWYWIKFGCDCVVKHGRKRRFFLACKHAHRKARELYEQTSVGSRSGVPATGRPFATTGDRSAKPAISDPARGSMELDRPVDPVSSGELLQGGAGVGADDAHSLSLVIPTRNCRPLIQRHLPSLRRCLPLVREVFVVDSESTDGTPELLRQKLEHPRLHFMSCPPGLYDAWNHGIRQCSSKYVYVATAGDAIEPDGLGHLLEVAGKFQADVVLSPPSFVTMEGRRLPQKEWSIHQYIADRGISSPVAIPRSHVFISSVVHGLAGFMGSASSNLYRTAALHRNPFPTDFGHVGDVAWGVAGSLRLRMAVTPRRCAEYVLHSPSVQATETAAGQNGQRLWDLAVTTLADAIASGDLPAEARELNGFLDEMERLWRSREAALLDYARQRERKWPWLLSRAGPAAWLRRRRERRRFRLFWSRALRQFEF